MDRTAYLLRRTLLCAVFACPLAAVSLPAAWIAQGVWMGLALSDMPAAPVLWTRPARPFAPLLRGLAALCPALAAEAALGRLWAGSAFAGVAGSLTILTGILMQAALIRHVQKPGRRHLAACLVCALTFIACTR